MDVNRQSFSELLPTLLEHTSKSHFIAIDLELSGIPTWRSGGNESKQNLEERYQQIKAAAEKYHILQVGLTFVEQDADNGKYITRPYNFNISPLIYDGLEIERTFSYSTGAVEFLINHGYQMDSPFAKGIPYLTNEEADLARQRAASRWDKPAIADIKIKDDDVQAIEFMGRARKEIKQWIRSAKPDAEFLNISGKHVPSASDPDYCIPMSRFERRLVHQLVRAEFPTLQTNSRADFIQVRPKDPALDDKEQALYKESKQRRFEGSLFSQLGFGWVMDAMAGKDLSGIRQEYYDTEFTAEPGAQTLSMSINHLSKTKEALQARKSVLVGHNCFMDLVFIYRQFYGRLPDNLKDFVAALHEVFPLIIDTKYMATAGMEGAMFRSMQLWQIEERLKGQEKPLIELAPDHLDTSNAQNYHEAGFDSWVTAKVFLQLASNLDTASGDQGKHDVRLNVQPKPKPKDELKPKVKRQSQTGSASQVAEGKFFHTNMYESLVDAEEASSVGVAENPASSSNTARPSELERTTGRLGSLSVEGKSGGGSVAGYLIPGFEDRFWQAHANQLRVYGTVEESLALDGRDDAGDEATAEKESNNNNHAGNTLWAGLEKAVRNFI